MISPIHLSLSSVLLLYILLSVWLFHVHALLSDDNHTQKNTKTQTKTATTPPLVLTPPDTLPDWISQVDWFEPQRYIYEGNTLPYRLSIPYLQSAEPRPTLWVEKRDDYDNNNNNNNVMGTKEVSLPEDTWAFYPGVITEQKDGTQFCIPCISKEYHTLVTKCYDVQQQQWI